MHQNAMQYAPKREAKCCKMQGKMQQNAAKTHKKQHFKRYL